MSTTEQRLKDRNALKTILTESTEAIITAVVDVRKTLQIIEITEDIIIEYLLIELDEAQHNRELSSIMNKRAREVVSGRDEI